MAILKARDVRERLKGRVDPQVSFVLEALAEQQHTMIKSIMEISQMVDKMADIIGNFVQVADNMKRTVDGMKGADKDDLPAVTQ